MNTCPSTTKGTDTKGHWDDLGVLERLNMVLDYRNLFLSLGLITDRELRKVLAASEGSREYIAERDGHLMFDQINLTEDLSGHHKKVQNTFDAIFDDLGIF